MKVILKKDVEKLGKTNEVHEVADGYARNYLLPRGLAIPASEGALEALKDLREDQAEREARLKQEAEDVAETLRKEPLRFTVKAGESGRLYGSVTNADITEAIEETFGLSVDKRAVQLEQPIRELGPQVVDLNLEGDVVAQVRVVVEPEE
jgi:large subunit ribosomal protein L9